MSINKRTAIGGAVAIAAMSATTAGALVGDPIRVSVDNGGQQAMLASTGGAVSAQGRHVAFVSAANLSGVDTGGVKQLYVRNRATGATVLASSSKAGVPANAEVLAGTGSNAYFDINADGRYVVFGSAADNLSPGDQNGKQDVFLKDLQTGRVNVLSAKRICGATPSYSCITHAGNGDSRDPSISADGDAVAYTTDATNLGWNDTDDASEVIIGPGVGFPGGSAVQGESAEPHSSPSISADGKQIAFRSGGTIVVRDRAHPSNYIAVGAGSDPDLSGDGRFVAFTSTGAFSPADDNGTSDIYRYGDGKYELVSSRDGQASPGNGPSHGASMSADGERVVFTSAATDLVAGDSNGKADAYARHISAGATSQLSTAGDGTGGAEPATATAVAPNGGLAVFDTESPLSASDTNGISDVFARDLGATDTTGPVASRVYWDEGYKGFGDVWIAQFADDPSGVVHYWVTGETRDGAMATVTAVDGAGNERVSQGAATVLRHDYSHLGDGPSPSPARVESIKIRSIKLVKNGVRISYSTTGGNGMAWADFRLQRVRLARSGKTLGYSFASKARVGTISAGTRAITLPRPRAKGTYRVRALIGKGKHRVLVVKRFRIGGPVGKTG